MNRTYLRVVFALSLTLLLVLPQAAFAGEWAPGQNASNGAASHANSECVFNGQDDDDLEDDDLWAMTPAGGRVQSGGQLIAIGAVPAGIQGQACNGNLNPLNP